MFDKILQGNVLEVLKDLPDNFVDCVMTSPPYWSLRDYGENTAVVWDGKKNCQRKWTNSNTMNFSFGQNETAIKHPSFDKMSTEKVNCYKCVVCGAWKGQLGLEPDFRMYIKHLCDIFDEVRRVLKPTGTCWVNIGDTYSGNKTGKTDKKIANYLKNAQKNIHKKKDQVVREKSLVLVPFRFAIEMVNRGWILRNTIIWHKVNCMPSSVRDRFTTDFEYLFFFTKSKKYFFEQQLEENKNLWGRWGKYTNPKMKKLGHGAMSNAKELSKEEFEEKYSSGRNMRAVWTMRTKPFPEAHFAVYPEALCETPIKAGCPRYVCKKCGEPKKTERVPINLYECSEAKLVKKDEPYSVQYRKGNIKVRKLPKKKEIINYLKKWKGDKTFTQIGKFMGLPNTSIGHWFSEVDSSHGFSYPTKEQWVKLKEFLGFDDTYDEAMTKEYVKPAGVCETKYGTRVISCDCNVGFRAGVVLDPFMGSGTTAVVAKRQKKHYIGIELNKEYIKIAEERIKIAELRGEARKQAQKVMKLRIIKQGQRKVMEYVRNR